MSSIKLPHASGNSMSIAAPATNPASDLELKLPATVGTAGQALVNSETPGILEFGTPATAYRNRIINGGMQVWQRSTSTASVGSADTHIADRFRHVTNGAARYTVSKDTDVPAGYGFSNSMKLDCTTVNANSAANFVSIEHRIEGQDLQVFCKGTAQAKKFTLSFHVKSPKTGVHIVELFDNDTGSNRHCSQSYTITAANTWQKIELTFPADTTGAFDNDNNASLRIFFWMAAGSDYSSGTLATSWAAFASANRAVGQVNCFDNTSNDFYITGIQLEVGDTVTQFEHKTFADELARCQRYCFVETADDGDYVGWNGLITTQSAINTNRPLPVPMRTAPSYTGNSKDLYFQSVTNSNTLHFDDAAVWRTPTTVPCTLVALKWDVSFGSTSGKNFAMPRCQQDGAKMIFSAEL